MSSVNYFNMYVYSTSIYNAFFSAFEIYADYANLTICCVNKVYLINIIIININ